MTQFTFLRHTQHTGRTDAAQTVGAVRDIVHPDRRDSETSVGNLYRRPPVEGRTMMDLRNRIIAGRYTPVPPGRYSSELTSICHSLLSTDPNRRCAPVHWHISATATTPVIRRNQVHGHSRYRHYRHLPRHIDTSSCSLLHFRRQAFSFRHPRKLSGSQVAARPTGAARRPAPTAPDLGR